MLLSGGIDSATALYLTRPSRRVRVLTFEYHGIARSEVQAAKSVATSAGAREHRLIRLPDLKEIGNIRGTRFEGLPPTYIPLRNSVFYSLAASYAEEIRATAIVGGHNREDQTMFSDVRPEFFRSLERALLAASPILRKIGFRIEQPLSGMNKSQVVKLAHSLGVPLEQTWSCHRGGRNHCWRCAGCLSRGRAFAEAGLKDPLKSLQGKVT